jgi:hypothetical protein
MLPIGTDPTHQLSDDEIVQLIQKALIMNDLESNFSDQTTSYITSITGRIQSYQDSGFSN